MTLSAVNFTQCPSLFNSQLNSQLELQFESRSTSGAILGEVDSSWKSLYKPSWAASFHRTELTLRPYLGVCLATSCSIRWHSARMAEEKGGGQQRAFLYSVQTNVLTNLGVRWVAW